MARPDELAWYGLRFSDVLRALCESLAAFAVQGLSLTPEEKPFTAKNAKKAAKAAKDTAAQNCQTAPPTS
jgi:hypothetical protein